VLVDRADGVDRRGALAVLAQALCPELAEPERSLAKGVGIGQEDRGGNAVMAGQRDRDRRPQRRGAFHRFLGRQGGFENLVGALAHCLDIHAGKGRRQEPDQRQHRKAPADARVVVEASDVEFPRQAAQGIVGGLGYDREAAGDSFRADRVAKAFQAGEKLHHGLRRAAGL
jgi:hypothetical protein